MKGQTVIIGAILLIFIITAIAAGMMTFTEDITDLIQSTGTNQTDHNVKTSEAGISVMDVYSEDKIEIKNVGETELDVSKFVVYLDGAKIDINNSCDDKLKPGQKCNLTSTGTDLVSGELKITGEYSTWDQLNLTEL